MKIFASILLVLFSIYTLFLIPGVINKKYQKTALITILIVTAPVIVFMILYLFNVGG